MTEVLVHSFNPHYQPCGEYMRASKHKGHAVQEHSGPNFHRITCMINMCPGSGDASIGNVQQVMAASRQRSQAKAMFTQGNEPPSPVKGALICNQGGETLSNERCLPVSALDAVRRDRSKSSTQSALYLQCGIEVKFSYFSCLYVYEVSRRQREASLLGCSARHLRAHMGDWQQGSIDYPYDVPFAQPLIQCLAEEGRVSCRWR